MGIVNVTPDSFSDGGRFLSHEAAVAHALRLVEDGADILDIGGESTRPGSTPVELVEELRRVVPVIRALNAKTKTPISIDTSKAEVASQCVAAGASIINDVTALTGDPRMVEVASSSAAGLVLMHMQGTPATMQDDPSYDDVVADVVSYLDHRIRNLTDHGIHPDCLAIDKGIGFGKPMEHNLTLLARLGEFQKLGRPLCLGISRKGIIGQITGRPRNERVIGSVAAACHASSHGAAQILRVHDVKEHREAVSMIAAIEEII